MSEADFMADVVGDCGLIAAERVADLLHITRRELVAAMGLPRDRVAKAARVRAPAARSRLRDMVEIVNRVEPWAGSPMQAFAWHRCQPIPSFGDETAVGGYA